MSAGETKETLIVWLPRSQTTVRGTLGVVRGVAVDEALQVLVATSFVPLTAQVCKTPFASPLTTIGDDDPELVTKPPLAVVQRAVNDKNAPPFAEPGVNAIEIWALPGMSDMPTGAVGTPTAVALADGDDATDIPAALRALTVQVY